VKRESQCRTSAQDQLNLGQPVLDFVTVTVPATATTYGTDILVKFAKPHRFFMIASILSTVANAGLFVHLKQLGLPQNGTPQITPTGGENWVPISNSLNSAGRCEGRWFKFREPVTQFYIDADHPTVNPAGGQYNITFLGTDDIDAIISERT